MVSALLALDDVIADLLAKVSPTQKTITRPLSEALGCYLAVDITSRINVPPDANSAMDGYAVRSSEIV